MSVYTRSLRESDVPAIVSIHSWLHQNSRYKVFSYNSQKVRNLLSASLQPNSDIFVSIAFAEGSDEILGYFHGFVDYHYFSNDLFAGEWAVIVVPGHRRKAPAVLKSMVTAFETWAKSKGVAEISIASSTEASGTGYKKFLQRMGYRDVGFLCVKG
tara:strand:- start:635 stop:1102 length:468 start_codon:yes stop_codon:yes gene_type:complete